jgi:opacity protein-like surface antigen
VPVPLACAVLSATVKGTSFMHRRLLVFAAGLLLAVPVMAQAQEKRALFSVGGGFTAPNSEVRDRIGDGFNFNVGLQVNVTPIFAIEGLYSYNGLGEKDISIDVFPQPLANGALPGTLSGGMDMQYGTVNFIVQKPEGGVRPYGLTGFGVYHRSVEVTSPSVGYVPGYCDPWWYVCYPGGWVEVENVLGERSSTDFGMNFGGGVNFGVFFAELRYHYVWGPEVEQQTTVNPLVTPAVVPDKTKANGQFLATTFGFRF